MTLFFCQPDINSILSLRCILLCFEAVSSLRINYDKSELAEFGHDCPEPSFALVLGCKATNLPIKYMGTPLEIKHKDSSC